MHAADEPFTLDALRRADRRATAHDVATRIAHELGTPLAVIVARAELLAASASGSPELLDHVVALGTAAGRASETLRTWATAKERAPKTRAENVASLVEHALACTESDRVRTESSVDPTLSMRVDAATVAQVLTELVANGIQATPDGGTVSVTARREHVVLPDDPNVTPGVFLCLEIRDGGPGLTAAELARHVDPPVDERAAHAGRGLSTCACVAREHDGDVYLAGGAVLVRLRELEA